MPFGIPSEDFHGGFGIPHDDDEPVAVVKHPTTTKEAALTELLIRAGVTWAPRKVARFLLANGVDIMKGDNE
jgi:hypothetical protein